MMENRIQKMRRLKDRAEEGTLNEKIAYADWMLYHCPDQINETNLPAIRSYYMDGVRNRNVRAILGMGQMYEEGCTGKENIPAAMRLYRRAVSCAKEEAERQMAVTLLARLYLERTTGNEQDTAADLIFQEADRMTDLKFAPFAMVMGDLQRNGIGVRKCAHSAYESYLMAKSVILSSEENRRFLPDILIRYGEVYGFGLYVPKDQMKAEGYFAEAEALLGSEGRSRQNRERIQKDRLAIQE